MGLDYLHLRVLVTSSNDPVENSNANKASTLMEKGRHWLLVITNESLPIFLDTAIVIFGCGQSLSVCDAPDHPASRFRTAGSPWPLVLALMPLRAPRVADCQVSAGRRRRAGRTGRRG
ncbi:hypothetical protein DFH07DRAFT_81220 [Mycena maculata]|uniref:Uncharacterized protein n=1 Tax=Mycena maculata TaxID=230809 RepID=A0AAD7ICH1_9AGAR|nr:hypothetical protein DFH07DRAFT_81220 [Mycena maculata]